MLNLKYLYTISIRIISIRAGLSYLYFTMGLLGSMLLFIIAALIEIGNALVIGLNTCKLLAINSCHYI